MKVYIAGKITGDPHYKQKFQAAADLLTEEGHTVMNPTILPLGFEHHEYMKICFCMIDVCECVYFLPDWAESEGAKAEYKHAKLTGKEIREN